MLIEFKSEKSRNSFGVGILLKRNLIFVLLFASSYSEEDSPSLESMEDEKYFARQNPNSICGFGNVTDDKDFNLNFFSALKLDRIIFNSEEVYPNFPDVTIISPAFAPFLLGILLSGKVVIPIILQSTINSLDSFVSPPRMRTLNSFDAFENPAAKETIFFLE